MEFEVEKNAYIENCHIEDARKTTLVYSSHLCEFETVSDQYKTGHRCHALSEESHD